MTYIIEKGHPMSGMCIVNEYDRDGGELQAQYEAWYRPYERKWDLYPLKNNSWKPMGKKVLPESAVKAAPRTAPRTALRARKTNTKTKKEEQPKDNQIRLV